ncbi:MAG: MFS transporter [Bdellovibrionales bacterium]|nr:MFS transporter [Bdellovibrionales bacterium]
MTRSKIRHLFSGIDRQSWSWALADWANSAYTTTVIAVFFPIFFKEYWASDLSASQSTFYLGLSNSANSIIVFLIAPFMGTLADVSHKKKWLLGIFTTVGALTLIPFFFISRGDWQTAIIFFTISNIGYWLSNIFYDALLVDVSTEKNISFVSSLGFSLGYLGGGILIVINAIMTAHPELLGIENTARAVQWSFITVCVWWILFSLPLFFFVKENKSTARAPLSESFRRFRQTFLQMRQHRDLFLFLAAYIFYIDGVNTIIKMAVDFALSIGLKSSDLILAIILVQFIGFPATLIYAWLAQKIGDKPSIYVGLAIYSLATVYSYFISNAAEFYGLAIVIGLVQGGLQAMSRSFFGKMTPRDQAGEFFGFYNMVGKFSAILGPLAVGAVSLTTDNPRVSILIVLIFFIIGGAILSRVGRPRNA